MIEEQDQNKTRTPTFPPAIKIQEEQNLKDEFMDDQSSDSNEPYFSNVEKIMDEIPTSTKSQRQQQLQAQIDDLQMKCNYLAITNERLLEKLGEYADREKEKESQKNLQIQLSKQTDQITEFQLQLSELQSWLLSFKQEFAAYQQKVSIEFCHYWEKIEELQTRNQLIQSQRDQIEMNLSSEKQNNYALIRRNEELLMELEEQKEKQVYSQRTSYKSITYETDFQSELELIIDKLAKELRHEKNMRKKYSSELKEINQELQQSEKIIQKKNQIIYNLQLRLLSEEKNNLNEEGYQRIKTKKPYLRYTNE